MGKILIHGSFVGQQAGCLIFDVDSNEELQRLVPKQPPWPFMEWEITPPLISTEQAMESVKQALASVRTSKK